MNNFVGLKMSDGSEGCGDCKILGLSHKLHLLHVSRP